MTQSDDKRPEEKKPGKKKMGFWRKYFGFFALVAGISSAGKPWDEEDAKTGEKNGDSPEK